MKLSKKSLIIALIVILISISSATYLCIKNRKVTAKPKVSISNRSDQLSQKEKLADFEYMYTVLKENYPFFEVNKRMNNVDWLNKKSEYIKEIKTTKNDQEFYTSLNNIVNELNNKHTEILNKNEYCYLTNILSENVNSKVHITDDAFYKELDKERTELRYYCKWKENKNMPNSSVNSVSNNIANTNIHTEILVKGKVAYLSILGFGNTEEREKDMKQIKPFLQGVKDYNTLIIDIRGNGGGFNNYWSDYLVPLIINKTLTNKEYYLYRGGDFSTSFIKCSLGDYYNDLKPIEDINKEGLKNLPPEANKDFKYYFIFGWGLIPKDSIGFKGKIYMLVDKDVYSAAESFASFSKHTGFATLVGEKTGGDGIGGTPLVCSLPNSGYVLRFSYVMGLTSDGSCDEEVKTEPDIKVNDATKAANLNDDKTVQTVLKLLKYK